MEGPLFPTRDAQLATLDAAYTAFCDTLQALPPGAFLASLGDWTPRDIAAHFIGWNRITLAGCAALREGALPFYFHDGTNDYRRINAGFIQRYASREPRELLAGMASAMNELVSYLKGVPLDEWEKDTGVVHYRGGPATVARCVDSLLRDYGKHREEILAGPK
jgi:hypothetical protein